MSTDRRWAAKYSELLQGFTDALGGADTPPAKLAICRTIATLQTQLTVMGDQFANGAASADDLNTFLKISTTIGSLLQSIELDQVLQQPVANDREGDDARDELRQLFDKLFAARRLEESKGVFRSRDGVVLDNSNHVAECECAPCQWRRSVGDEEADAAAEWRARFGHTAAQPTSQPRREPLVITRAPSPPAPPTLRVVPAAEPPVQPAAAPAVDSSQLEEQRSTVTNKRNDLEREISRLAEPALTDPIARSRRDQLMTDLTALNSELQQINSKMAARQPRQHHHLLFGMVGKRWRHAFSRLVGIQQSQLAEAAMRPNSCNAVRCKRLPKVRRLENKLVFSNQDIRQQIARDALAEVLKRGVHMARNQQHFKSPTRIAETGLNDDEWQRHIVRADIEYWRQHLLARGMQSRELAGYEAAVIKHMHDFLRCRMTLPPVVDKTLLSIIDTLRNDHGDDQPPTMN